MLTLEQLLNIIDGFNKVQVILLAAATDAQKQKLLQMQLDFYDHCTALRARILAAGQAANAQVQAATDKALNAIAPKT